jgi:thymidylate synthase
MRQYLDLVQKVLDEGIKKETRNGIDVLSINNEIITHNMSDGFPLLTTKHMPYKIIRVELEGFIKGITDKRWYQERGCHIWDDWCTPEKVPYGHDDETKRRMIEERDLGPLYGFQWRRFGAKYEGFDKDYSGKGVDQLKKVIEKLETDKKDRRMMVTAWNPVDNDKMALPPCHYLYHFSVTENRLNLTWDQRSVDLMLGLPFNIASYATLLHLIAKEVGLKEGQLTGQLKDIHIYENHLENARKHVKREPYKLSKIETPEFTSVFDWTHEQTALVKGTYKSHPEINYIRNV